ncbi:MAG TPA: membrane protein insertase YidC [Cyclobacteriaceae bacterium]|nr:membrane protein insertase YidC [Cyclobacteriaceae bacterium]
MDRNSAIGLTLIAALMMVYFFWLSPQPEKQPEQTAAPTTTEIVTQPEAKKEPVVTDSILTATYGDLSAAFKGEEKITSIETADLKINFSNKGGVIQFLELKNFKTYSQKPLILIEPSSNSFRLQTKFKGEEVDLYALYYTVDSQKSGDTTIVNYKLQLSNGAELTQTYKIPDSGYEIGYSIASRGLDKDLADQLTLHWNNSLRLVEKDIADNRNNTTINYNVGGTVDWLTERSTDTELETLPAGLKWISIKQKFFLRALVARNGFAGAEIQTSVDPADTAIVKKAVVKLLIAGKSVSDGTADFKFYLGPNDYKKIGGVAEKFNQNVYLGWPPVYWINRFVIFPVFYFLTTFINNFGLIIVILVIAIRIILLPLSYKSYLSMAKMKVLKPELDEIKEKHGEDMSKVQSEQLKLYQSVGVNPISGCIPLLLQMPILFAMFYLFPNTIELRQEHFLWAEDLSTYDSILNLPFSIPFYGNHVSLFTLLMTASTLVSVWQNSQMTSVQGPMKSMQYIMPIIFLFVLNSFPSGLSFYYFMTNIVTFGQQAIVKRFVDEDKIRKIMEENRKKNASGEGKKSKFMTKLQDAMKASEEARKNAEEARKKGKK